jgi:hypothetical protein
VKGKIAHFKQGTIEKHEKLVIPSVAKANEWDGKVAS